LKVESGVVTAQVSLHQSQVDQYVHVWQCSHWKVLY